MSNATEQVAIVRYVDNEEVSRIDLTQDQIIAMERVEEIVQKFSSLFPIKHPTNQVDALFCAAVLWGMSMESGSFDDIKAAIIKRVRD